MARMSMGIRGRLSALGSWLLAETNDLHFPRCVIPRSRVFASGMRDLACSFDAPRQIPFDSLPSVSRSRAGSSLRLKNGFAQDDVNAMN
jgi:hypothetical protein